MLNCHLPSIVATKPLKSLFFKAAFMKGSLTDSRLLNLQSFPQLRLGHWC